EAALGLIELHGRNADVEHDTVHRLAGDPLHFGKAAEFQAEPPAIACNQRLTGNDGIGIAVDGYDLGPAVQEGARITACPEGTVQNAFAWSRFEGFKHGIKKDRNVAGRSATGGLISTGARHHSELAAARACEACCRNFRSLARTSALCARSRSGSHIWKNSPRPTKATSETIPVCSRMKSVTVIRPS